jgi:hypothetical protein
MRGRLRAISSDDRKDIAVCCFIAYVSAFVSPLEFCTRGTAAPTAGIPNASAADANCVADARASITLMAGVLLAQQREATEYSSHDRRYAAWFDQDILGFVVSALT